MVGVKGRSSYNFQFNGDMNQVNMIVQNYLQANGFSQYEKKGEQFYRAGDQFVGYRGFKYTINGQNLNIEAWIISIKNDFKLEQNSMNIPANTYTNSINVLFQELAKLNGGETMNNNDQNNSNVSNNAQPNFYPNTGQPLNNGQSQQNNANQFAQDFQNDITKRQESMCEVGFWISIIGVVLSIFGVGFGLIVYILDYYLASQGLKTRKRTKAIVTIVLSTISIAIVIFGIATN